MGNETFVFLSVGPNRLIARAPADFRAEVESKVWLKLATERAHFFECTDFRAIYVTCELDYPRGAIRTGSMA
jgi:hypothetical protein